MSVYTTNIFAGEQDVNLNKPEPVRNHIKSPAIQIRAMVYSGKAS
jgi:hypothetical protein